VLGLNCPTHASAIAIRKGKKMNLQERADMQAQDRGFWGGGPTINFSNLVREIYKGANDRYRQDYYTQCGHEAFPAVLKHLIEAGFKANNKGDRNDVTRFLEGLSCHYKKFTSEDENTHIEMYMWKKDYQTLRLDVYFNDELPF
tara:strand:- start:817 stop:1248 length:432 start_codon:yes stop_codon:yes gene_type:complete